MSDAEKCRINGWKVGTVLEGDESYGPERIEITAIGVNNILARRITTAQGDPIHDDERCWTLMWREWKAVIEGGK